MKSSKEYREERISTILVEKKILKIEDQKKFLALAKSTQSELDILFFQEKLFSEEEYLATISDYLNISPLLLSAYKPNPKLRGLFPKEKAEEWGVLPIEIIDRSITIAITDPFNVILLDRIREFVRNFSIEQMTDFDFFPVFVSSKSLQEAQKNFYQEHKAEPMEITLEHDVLALTQDPEWITRLSEKEILLKEEEDRGVARLVNNIISKAYQMGASDIHIEPYLDKNVMVRFRIDGDCRKVLELPRNLKNAICTRLKIMSELDIAEHRKAQDGKIRFKKWGAYDIELRVAVIPTVGDHEDVVMRILAASKPIPLENLKMEHSVYNGVMETIQKPYGLFLVVGPTGSGKTTTLHSCLGKVNQESIKIWTIEDPVEITQEGLRQVQFSSNINFKQAMRAFLRGDPDVIMVGEMRDLETATTAIEASLTGHLVLSTLHTNNAPETIVRLLDLGLDPFAFSDSLLAVLAQRLIRSLCSICKREVKIGKDLKSLTDSHSFLQEKLLRNVDSLKGQNNSSFFSTEVDSTKTFEAVGCESCFNKGFKGRMGIYELLLSSPEIKQMIVSKASASKIREVGIRNGMRTLKQDGLLKVAKGFSTLQEVLSVCIE